MVETNSKIKIQQIFEESQNLFLQKMNWISYIFLFEYERDVYKFSFYQVLKIIFVI